MTQNTCPSIRDCAQAVIETIARDKGELETLRAGLRDALRPFLARPGLFSLGVKRPGNHIDNSKYLYYDGELSITLDQLPQALTRISLRVRPETLCRITEFSEHESNGRELDEGERVAVEVLPVLGQSAAAVEPGDGAFDHPTPGLDVSVRSGRGMGPVKRISHVEARPHKVLSFCW